MFNNKIKKEAITNLSNSIDSYNDYFNKLQRNTEQLYFLRKNSGVNIIEVVESYVNHLANKPKEFDKAFSEFKTGFKSFEGIEKELLDTAFKNNMKAGVGAGAGIAAGISTAALMPSAAIAVATTFGTASTGTAISALSGAAASNAALAWLGGGALTAGGSGMAGGAAFLSLAGPIGIGIGAIGIIGSGLFASSKNKEIAIKANEDRQKIEKARWELVLANDEIENLIKLTIKHQDGTLKILQALYNTAPIDYIYYSDENKNKLAALINHIQSLSKLINKKVGQ